MHVRRAATHIEILAPAKLNLFLEVLARRSDGFHEIETLLAAVTTYDTLTFIPEEGAGIRLEVRWAMGLAARNLQRGETGAQPYEELPPGAGNLVWRAATLLRERAGVKQGAGIRLLKRIPAAAGLGGASSDAAATLVAGNVAWGLNWRQEQLLELAAELGSDVPFFLGAGPAVGRGRGEKLSSAKAPRMAVVIVRPSTGLATREVYAACRPVEQPVGCAALAAALAANNVAEAGKRLVNSLEPAAELVAPGLKHLRESLQLETFLGQQMSGSGSSFFGLCRSPRAARRTAARLRARNLGMVYTGTTEVGA